MQRSQPAQLRHLYSRAGFGATPAQLEQAGGHSVRTAVKSLFADSQPFTQLELAGGELVDKGELKQMMRAGQIDRLELRAKIKEAALAQRGLNVAWIDRMAGQNGALREKMALFWHGHFACRINQKPGFVLDYVNVIRQHALGNFGELLLTVSKTPAMLQFLNNQQNRKNAPNENFAREVMELFTLGKAVSGPLHYTEHDVKEAARAFTGWGYTPEGQFVFREKVHDEGEKTIFGHTGPYHGDDVMAMLLKDPHTAHHVTTKIYRAFVNETTTPGKTEQQRIDKLADHFYATNYDIGALMEHIFTADWFYDDRNVGAHIKSPVELLAGIRHLVGVTFSEPQPQVFIQRTLGQLLLYPPNVAGWPGGRNWIDSSSLLFRMKLPDYVFKNAIVAIQAKEDGDVNVQPFGRKGGNKFTTQVDWAGFEATFANTPPAQLPDAIAACLLPWPLTPDQRNLLTQPATATNPLRQMAITMMSFPEFQLC